jgi:hypothetical protein
MAALGIALLTLVLLQGIVLVSYLAGLALMLPSWASSVAILVGCRDIPSARPRSACLGHLVCGAVGVAALCPGRETKGVAASFVWLSNTPTPARFPRLESNCF